MGFSKMRGTQPLSSTLGTTGLDVGNSEVAPWGRGLRDGWLESWADTSARSAQLVGGTAGLSTSEPQFLLLTSQAGW